MLETKEPQSKLSKTKFNKKIILILGIIGVLVLCCIVVIATYILYTKVYLPSITKEYISNTEQIFLDTDKLVQDLKADVEKNFQSDLNKTQETPNIEQSEKMLNESDNLVTNLLNKITEGENSLQSSNIATTDLNNSLIEYYQQARNTAQSYKILISFNKEMTHPLKGILNIVSELSNITSSNEDFSDNQQTIDDLQALAINIENNKKTIENISAPTKEGAETKSIIVAYIDALIKVINDTVELYNKINKMSQSKDVSLLTEIQADSGRINSEFNTTINELAERTQSFDKKTRESYSDEIDNINKLADEVKSLYISLKKQ